MYSMLSGPVKGDFRKLPKSPHNAAVSIDHYENFPVASWLCPPRLRPAVSAIYRFARTADDLADEGEASPAERQADLKAYRADLSAIEAGRAPSPRWAVQVFEPLAGIVRQFRLPVTLLHALLDAFEQDVSKSAYKDRAELLRYCERSANPVGRLLLHLYGIQDGLALQRSDSICTALQLINFWQDLTRDGPKGRVYVPEADLYRFGISREQMLACADNPPARAMVRNLCDWTEAQMRSGAPLALRIPGRAGWELRLVVQGGLRILEKIRNMQYASLSERPALTAFDAPLLLWRALRMSP